MPNNALVTGPPGSGKTTAIDRARQLLEDDGLAAGGVVAPEMRIDGGRVGFEIVDVTSGESAVMAHVDYASGPTVGKYRVDVDAVDRVAGDAFERAREAADFVVIDEIAPMEVFGDAFVREVRQALDAETPVVAAVQHGSTAGFVGEVKERDDAELFGVSDGNRDAVPDRLAAFVRNRLEG